ncbi:MBL fold metallo-hydrolase [Kribbella sp. NPDC051620]|uniref:MBL fold metallo-hydrolase n=1 Tax=Kribbella sp. NPDC051620 TaxID=3364120 RepID=UPI0037A637BC
MTTTKLSYQVHVSPSALRSGDQRMPNGDPLYWNPLSTTLISGERDAVLVDPPFLSEHIQEVGDWVERSGKRLIAIYATHGHGDHWFGTGELVKRFPGAVAYATPGTIEMMHQQAGVGREQLWDRIFPGQIPVTPVLAVPVPVEGIVLEGEVLTAVETGHTDTDKTSVLHVPSLGLVVAGDVAYNGIHQYIVEGGDGGFEEWIAALDQVAALEPTAVVAGHKNRDLPDDPIILQQTKQYLQDVRKLLAGRPTPQEFFDQMTALHPDRLNLSPLWYGALALLAR